MNKEELDPCFFCGGTAEYCARPAKNITLWVVKCMTCGTTSYPASPYKENARAYWNGEVDK